MNVRAFTLPIFLKTHNLLLDFYLLSSLSALTSASGPSGIKIMLILKLNSV